MEDDLDSIFETLEGGDSDESEEQVALGEKEAEPEGKVENDAETTAADKDSPAKTSEKHWSETAYLDEKGKRQNLERENAELKAKLQPKEEDDVDLFADPDKFKKSVDDKINNATLSTKISLSREFIMDSKPDYVEKEAKFVEMATADRSLVTKMNQSSNPAKFAYETASKQIAYEAKLKLVDEIGDPEAYKAKLKQEILDELKSVQPAKKPAKRVPSLATASATSGATKATTSLEDLVPE